jgi:signal-transduction protein with cAMP-binding, CBS, and nucleotidyltransferase domain
MVSEAFLKECDIFSGLNDDQLKKLIPISKEKTYAPGTLLYKIGNPSTHLNLVKKGKVFLQMIADMGPASPPMLFTADVVTHGHAFGWSAFDEPNLHTMNALIADPTTLINFEGDKLKALMEEDCEMGVEIMKGLSRLLASRLNQARILLINERALALAVD